jgi:hypothetical protein
MFEPVPPPSIPDALRWSFCGLKPSDSTDVRWIGPVHGLITHHTGVTKPCRAKLTGGVLPCELCDAKLPPRWRGYAPAVTFHGKRVVFLLGVDTGTKLHQVAAGTALTFFRGPGATAPVDFRLYDGMAAKLKSAAFLPGGTWGKGTDLWPWMCQLWGDLELTKLLADARDQPPARG